MRSSCRVHRLRCLYYVPSSGGDMKPRSDARGIFRVGRIALGIVSDNTTCTKVVVSTNKVECF